MSQPDTAKNTERRNFFRIDDLSIINYRVLSDDEIRKNSSSAEVYMQQLSLNRLTLKARFDSLSRELTPLGKVIGQANPRLAKYLSIIDKKLDMLSEVLMGEAIDELDDKPQRVNISAGGVSFFSPDPISTGSILELRIVLLPSNVGVYSRAKVVFCNKSNDEIQDKGRYKVAVEFERMDESFRDLVSKHVLSRERAALIANHENDDK